MAVKKDWLPAVRDTILTMVKAWLILIAANLQKWGIPESVSQTLAALATSAESALDTAKNESTRTPVATARCKEAFDALVEEMRDVKRRYFFLPPLTNADLGFGTHAP